MVGETTSVDGDARWKFVSLTGRAVTSLLAFFVLARAIGAESYGRYASILAISSILLPLADLGYSWATIADGAYDRRAVAGLHRLALRISAVGSPIVLAVAVLASFVLLPDADRVVLVLLVVAEALYYGPVLASDRAFQAVGEFRAAAFVEIGFGVARLSAVVVIAAVDGTLRVVAVGFVGAAVISSVASVLGFAARHPVTERARWSWPGARRTAPLAATTAAFTVQADIDQLMLVRADFTDEAGNYAAASKLINASLMPMQAVLAAVAPRLYASVPHGAGAVKAVVRTAGRRVLPLALFVGGGLLIASPIAQWLFGDEFSELDDVLRWAALLPLIRIVGWLLGDVVNAFNRRTDRLVSVLIACVVNIGLNLVLIPDYDWRGAMVATYVSELTLTALLAVSAARATR